MHYDSPLGPITITCDGEFLTGLCFGKTEIDIVNHYQPPTNIRHWLDIYFAGKQPDFMPSVNLRGTDFQRRVWQALLDIPYGHTTTYGELAHRIGCRSAQAVGQAVGSNPIAIIVPCHRVIGSDGTLTGYAYGIEKKRYLLQLEQSYS